VVLLGGLQLRVVRPFYLKMMGLNALHYEIRWQELARLSRKVRDDEVITLLRGLWRPRVMGAWLSAGREERLAAELLSSLQTSAGSLTAPPLAAVAVRGLGLAAVPALRTYLALDLEHHHGSGPFIAAMLESLGAVTASVAIEDQDRQDARKMLAIADRLASQTTSRTAR
jgi:hypothetical protein